MASVEGTQDNRRVRVAEHYLGTRGSGHRLAATVALAATSLGFPCGQINILDDRFQHTIAEFGIESSGPLPLEMSMCRHVLAEGALAVDDLAADARFAALPGVRAGVAGSYLGVPVASRESAVVGTLCLFDPAPRDITSSQVQRIREFAGIVEDQLDLLRRMSDGEDSMRGDSARLLRAIDAGEIIPWYQPVVDMATGENVAYEVLARWQHPGGGIGHPSSFLPLAEDSDLIIDMDRELLRQALDDLRRWQQVRPDIRINVNLSTRHLELGEEISVVHDAVLQANVDPATVVFEVTETRRLALEDRARTAVQQLRGHGHRVLLDDFGSGWSSLEWVLRLPVDGIKIDRAVTTALGTPVGDAIVRAAAGFAAELGLAAIIEGVATPYQNELAQRLGCQYGQGFYWSPPQPAAAIIPARRRTSRSQGAGASVA